VRAWVASPPERQRLAVFLRYFADLDYRSIAGGLEVVVGTVSATLATAHAALPALLRGGTAMKDIEPEIAESFDRVFPPLLVDPDWRDVIARADIAHRGSLSFSGFRARRLALCHSQCSSSRWRRRCGGSAATSTRARA
jgi:hypothetical protein